MYLNAHSYYSLRYGTLSVEDLVARCLAGGHRAVALTDINNSSGVLYFVKCCVEAGLKPLVGMEFRDGEDRLLYVCVARNNRGFRELNDLLTRRNLDGVALPARPVFDDCYIFYPMKGCPVGLRDNEYIGVTPSDLRRMISPSKELLMKCVAMPSLVYFDGKTYELHKQLRAIDLNNLITKVAVEDFARAEEGLMSVDELRGVYRSFPELLVNVERILDDCCFDFDFKVPKNKRTFTGSHSDDRMLLHKLAFNGMVHRYGSNNRVAEGRIRGELEVIDKLGFASYFLITWDIIRYSMERGFYHVGRGSGANSIVAYCLKITDVCPIELDLYFERFLNPKRKSPPDFDIDYSWKERDDVIDYIFKRFGREHTALLGAMSTFKDKSILRELGKVNGLPKGEIDNLIDNRKVANDGNRDAISDKIFGFRNFMHGLTSDFPNLRSIHAGGILISEEPITCYTALDLPPKNFAVAQFDMYIAEDIGFQKLDILSQRGIGHIKECAEIVLKKRGVKIDVHNVAMFKNDAQVKHQLKVGDTIGCFYIESPAMRGLLKKLRCDNYLSLTAASSIIRPGVASSGMMREYIWRFHHPDKFEYLHPVMEEQLKETYGVMIYQEDVLKVCHYFGGLDLADADVLRRMMSGKGRKKKEVEIIIQKFFDNCKAKGYPEALTQEVWRQIESFAGYSFSKAHSASYAVESFQSLYLKAHYPLEFMVAVINNFGGFYNTRVYINEARKAGANICLPCVNNSLHTTTIYGKDIYLGFIHIQNLEAHFAHLIVEERERHGAYRNMEDLVARTAISLEQLIVLIRVNALRFIGKPKKELLWEAHVLLHNPAKPIPSPLFETPHMEYKLPQFEMDKFEDAYDEIELIGFPVTVPDFDLLRTEYRGEIQAPELISHEGKTVKMLGSYVTTKPVRTKRGDMMAFGTFFDSQGNFFDTTHFPQSLQHSPMRGYGMYLILGKVVEEFGFPSIEVERMAKLPIHPDPRGI